MPRGRRKPSGTRIQTSSVASCCIQATNISGGGCANLSDVTRPTVNCSPPVRNIGYESATSYFGLEPGAL
jgi:hypothetical protein